RHGDKDALSNWRDPSRPDEKSAGGRTDQRRRRAALAQAFLSLRGKWRGQYTPKLKKRTALLQKLREVFRQHRSQPVQGVVAIINPILRGWVNYFAMGHSSRCFQVVKRWVELKVRRHLMRSRNRRGVGWERWSTQALHATLLRAI